MPLVKTILLYCMAAIYCFAGAMHFIKPKFFLSIVPPYIPFPKLANWVSGFFEILFAVGLLFPQTRSIAAIGIMLLLIAVFPANYYHYQLSKGSKMQTITLIRLPFQLLFILWAYWYV